MKILFVRPKPSAETIGLQHVMIVEPLELEVLASLVRQCDIPTIVDLIIERRSYSYFLEKERPDLVCLTGYITHVDIMIEYCRITKKFDPKIITVLGGVHCEVCPGDFDDPSVDFRVVRNATIAFPELLNYLDNNRPLPPGILKTGASLNKNDLPAFNYFFPLPNRDLTARYRKFYFYIFHDKVALIKTSFGCPFKCNFCFCTRITDGNYFERPLEDVVEELKNIREREIYIVDDDFLVNKRRLKDFISANQRLKLNKKYLIYGRADFIAQNPELMRDFSSAGLSTVIVGFESFFEEELNSYHKGIDATINRQAMEILNSLGIDCYATIIIPPHWTKEHFNRCYEAMKSIGIHYVNLQPLTPLPDTKIGSNGYDLLFTRKEYAKWDLAHVTVRPTEMSISEFYKEIVRLYDRILYTRSVLFMYLEKYRLSQVWKILMGSMRVKKQYSIKIREAKILDQKYHSYA